SVLFKGPVRKGATARIELPASGWVAAVRLLAMPPSSRDSRGVDGKGKRTTIQLSAAVRKNGQAGETRVPFYYADAEKKEPRFVNGHEVIGVVNGWTLSTQPPNENQTSNWLLDPPQKLDDGDTLVLTVRGDNIERIRLAYSPIPGFVGDIRPAD